MRMLLVAGLCAAALPACMTVPIAVPSSPDYDHDRAGYGGYGELSSPPLRIQLWGPPSTAFATGASGGFRFHVNRPAHVAMFVIVPGAGVRLLYPSYGPSNYLAPGYHSPFLGSSLRHGFGSGWLGGRAGLFDDYQWSYADGRAGPGYGLHHGPFFVLAIASEDRIPLEMMGYRGAYLRTRHLTSFSAWSMMDALVDVLLPGVPESAYATDMVMIWPEPPREQHSRVVFVAARTDSPAVGDTTPLSVSCPGDERLDRAAGVARGTRRLCPTANDSGEAASVSTTIREWREAERAVRVPSSMDEGRTGMVQRVRTRTTSGLPSAEAAEGGERRTRPVPVREADGRGNPREAESRTRPAPRERPTRRAGERPAPASEGASPPPREKRPAPVPERARPSSPRGSSPAPAREPASAPPRESTPAPAPERASPRHRETVSTPARR